MSKRLRIVAAFLIAPGLTALVVGMFLRLDEFLAYASVAAVVTYAHALILGLPAYLLLRNRLNVPTVAGASFAIGALPVFVLASINMGDYSMVNGKVLVEGGRTTWAGYVANLDTATVGGLLGLATGAIWLAIAGTRKQ